MKKFGLFLFVIFFFQKSFSQNINDILRISSNTFGSSARSLSMGNAFTSIADDYSAVNFNPAGLGIIENSEFSLSFSNIAFNSDVNYLNNISSYKNRSTNFNQLGLVFPVSTVRGSFVVGIGYSSSQNFLSGSDFQKFNTQSSIIQDWASNNSPFNSNNIAYNLFLANPNFDSTSFISPIKDSLFQQGNLSEDGKIDRYSLAFSIEAEKNLFFGVSMNLIRGNYNYSLEYIEEDIYDVYDTNTIDLEYLAFKDVIDEEIAGVDFSLGAFYMFDESGALGLNIRTPSYISIKDEWKILREVKFASATEERSDFVTYDDVGEDDAPLITEYEVQTPFTFSFGASYMIFDFLLLSASSDYTDYTEMKFTSSDFDNVNRDIKKNMREVFAKHYGGELLFTDWSLKMGYMNLPSPYKNDPKSYDKIITTYGANFTIQEKFLIDVCFAKTKYESKFNAPDIGNIVKEKISLDNYVVTFTYRY